MAEAPTTSPRLDWRKRTLITAAVVALVVCIALAVYHWMPKRLAVVDPGVLYRSAQPSTRQIDHLQDRYGIKTIVIVREGSSHRVPDEVEHAGELGINVVHIPIKSRQEVPDEEIEQFFDVVDDPENQPVLVHCSAGRHRTGLLCALYRIERQGWSVERAIDEMLSFKFDQESQHAVLTQLRDYEPGRSVTTTQPTETRETRSASE